MWTTQRTYPERTALRTKFIIGQGNGNCERHAKLQGKKESEVSMLTKGNEKANRIKEEVKSKHHCYRCGSHEHTSTQCYFRNESSRKCGKVGHIQRVCRSRKGQQSTSRGVTKEENRKLHSFEIADELDNLIGSLEVNNVNQAVGDVIWNWTPVQRYLHYLFRNTGKCFQIYPWSQPKPF